MPNAIEVTELRKTYGELVAVADVSFSVAEGEIFGMVGPNGAGKTTTVECIEGLRTRDGGSVTVLGRDPADRTALSELIGVQLQESALPDRIKVREALDLFAALYRDPADPAVLLEALGLEDKAAARFDRLSGGQKQRLFIALALIGRPKVVFFDELTTGLDPQARRAMWDLVRQVRDDGTTVVLTTHFMEEAERLCDRVLIMDEGRVVALDTPEALVRSIGAERRLIFTLDDDAPMPDLRAVAGVTRVERGGGRIIVYGAGERLVSGAVRTFEDAGLDFGDLRTEQPNLDDVFLQLTGREMRE